MPVAEIEPRIDEALPALADPTFRLRHGPAFDVAEAQSPIDRSMLPIGCGAVPIKRELDHPRREAAEGNVHPRSRDLALRCTASREVPWRVVTPGEHHRGEILPPVCWYQLDASVAHDKIGRRVDLAERGPDPFFQPATGSPTSASHYAHPSSVG